MATTTAARLVLPTGQEWPLTGDVLTIGRAVGNNIQIDEQHVSAEHAKIMRLGSDYLLLDLRSSNGTYVNEQRVEDLHRLQPGDVIAIGAAKLTFVRRLVRLEDEMPLHTLTASFVFADTTGRRWLAVRILAALLVLALLTSIILFFLLVLR